MHAHNRACSSITYPVIPLTRYMRQLAPVLTQMMSMSMCTWQVPLLTNKWCSPFVAKDPFGQEVLLFPWIITWITDWPEGAMISLIQGGWKCKHFCRFCFCPTLLSFQAGFFAQVCTACELPVFPKLALTDNAIPQPRTAQNTRELIDDVFIARANNDAEATSAAEQV